MSSRGWKERLTAEVHAVKERRRLSMRKLGEQAGLGPSFVREVLIDGKIPSLENFMKLCEGLGIDPILIISGIKIGREEMELIRLWQSLPDEQAKAHFLGLAQSLARKPPDEAQP